MIAIPDTKKPWMWAGSLLQCCFRATSERDAPEPLLQQKQSRIMPGYLLRSDGALADCPT